MKLYTKRGDDGGTDLFAGGRTTKTDPRICAIGEVELGAADALDGRVSCDEFVNRGVRNPLITRALDRWFQVRRRVVGAPQEVLNTVGGEPISKLLQGSYTAGMEASEAGTGSGAGGHNDAVSCPALGAGAKSTTSYIPSCPPPFLLPLYGAA